MRILIVEDNFIQKELLELYVDKIGHEVVGTFETGEKALINMNSLKVDLVLMDINLKGLKNGVETAQEIQEKWGIKVIFTTAQTDFDVLDRAADTQPLDILIKPFSIEQLKASLLLARYKPQKEAKTTTARYIVKDGYLVYKDGHMFERLPLSELIYAEGAGNYFDLHFINKKTTLKGTLGELEKELPQKAFCRINRSIIVAISAISSFNNRRVVLKSKEEFKLSQLHSEKVLEKLMGL